MALTKQEFIEKYGFPKPYDSKERDMIIKLSLSGIKIKMSLDINEAMKMIDGLKYFMWDTEDVRDSHLSSSELDF